MVDFDAEFAKHADARRAKESAAADYQAARAAQWARSLAELDGVVSAARDKLISSGVEPLKWIEADGSPSSGYNLRPGGEAMWPLINGLAGLGIGTSGRFFVRVHTRSARDLIAGEKNPHQLFRASLETRFARLGVTRDGEFVSDAIPAGLDPENPANGGAAQFGLIRLEQDGRFAYHPGYDYPARPLVDYIIEKTAALCLG